MAAEESVPIEQPKKPVPGGNGHADVEKGKEKFGKRRKYIEDGGAPPPPLPKEDD